MILKASGPLCKGCTGCIGALKSVNFAYIGLFGSLGLLEPQSPYEYDHSFSTGLLISAMVLLTFEVYKGCVRDSRVIREKQIEKTIEHERGTGMTKGLK